MASEKPSRPDDPGRHERELIAAARRQELDPTEEATTPFPPAAGGDSDHLSSVGEDVTIAHVGASLLDSLAAGRGEENEREAPVKPGRYEILEPLGKGGMGEVLKARDRRLGRTVAIKRVHARTAGSQQALARFLAEARTVAALNHYNIVQVYDIDQDEAGLFIVMEYIEGEDLRTKIHRDGRFDPERAVEIVRQLCNALSYAHARGIIHRDIKPGNILINTQGTPKLVDFGLAHMTHEEGPSLTQTGAVMGTIDYASPEQLTDSKSVDHRTDIYSLGATLYEMLTGLSPRLVEEGKIPEELRACVVKSLCHDRQQRHQSADEFSEALTRVVIGDLETLTRKAAACHQAGDLEGALQRYERVLRIDARHVQARQQVSLIQSKIQQMRQDRQEANEAASRGDWEAAAGAWQRVLDVAPGDLEAIQQHGRARVEGRNVKLAAAIEEARRRLEQQDLSAAEAQCDLAAEIDPQNQELAELCKTIYFARRRLRNHKIRAATEAFHQKDYAATMVLVDEALGMMREDHPDRPRLVEVRKLAEASQCIAEADRLIDAGDMLKAAELLNQAEAGAGKYKNLLKRIEERRDRIKKQEAIASQAMRRRRTRQVLLLGGSCTCILVIGLSIAWRMHHRTQPAHAVMTGPKTVDATHQPGRTAGPDQPRLTTAKGSAGFRNTLGMEMVLIPPGEFMMGGERPPYAAAEKFGGDEQWFYRELPRHSVRIGMPFYMGVYEVTVGQFRRFVEATNYVTAAEREGWTEGWIDGQWHARLEGLSWKSPGFGQDEDYPVACVTWNDAVAFCTWLNGREGREYRLPSEAEWEYACRAGTHTAYWWGDDPDITGKVANVADWRPEAASLGWKMEDGYNRIAPVGHFRQNPFGLYDMIGNVWEWCADAWHDDYAGAPADGAAWTTEGDLQRHVIRGGSCYNSLDSCRSAGRLKMSGNGNERANHIGFRLVAATNADEAKDALRAAASQPVQPDTTNGGSEAQGGTPATPPKEGDPSAFTPGLRAILFAGGNFNRKVRTRIDRQIDFNWGNEAPDVGMPADHFSIQWVGWLKVPKAGQYTLATWRDDGVRVWVDGTLLINGWWPTSYVRDQAVVDLTAGFHSIRVDYFEYDSAAGVHLYWSQEGGFREQIVPAEALFHDPRAEFTMRVTTRTGANQKGARTNSPVYIRINGDRTLRRQLHHANQKSFERGAVDTFESLDFYYPLREVEGFVLNPEGPDDWWVESVSCQFFQGGAKTREYTFPLNTRLRDAGPGRPTCQVFLRCKPSFDDRPAEPAALGPKPLTWQVKFYASEKADRPPGNVFEGKVLYEETVPSLEYVWGFASPSPAVPVDCFATRATSEVELPPGRYRFRSVSDDAVRVFVDGKAVLDTWAKRSWYVEVSAQIELTQRKHTVVVEHYETYGWAQLLFWIEPETQ